jgi:hypothetical protein
MTHRAPWSSLLVWASVFSVAVLIAVPVVVARAVPYPLLALPVVLMSALTLAGGVLFMVRGYALDGNELRVRRPLWDTCLPLDGLRSAYADPQAMKRSLRLFGNGGMFSITGLFRNATLGNYRAWANDPARAVVLRFADRTAVITPEDPAAFLADLARHAPGATIGRQA